MKDDKVTLYQILRFIERIEEYTKNMRFDEFLEDYKSQDAVIRNIEIIGEASNRLSSNFILKHPSFPLNETRSMRNKLIHGYDDVDLSIVWVTATTDIQTLKLEILKII